MSAATQAREEAAQLIIKQQKAEADALAAREASKTHMRKFNNEALQCFIDGGLSVESAKLAVTLIAKKSITNVTINY